MAHQSPLSFVTGALAEREGRGALENMNGLLLFVGFLYRTRKYFTARE